MKILFSLCFLICSLASANSVHVGNGRVGFERNGVVYLRELYLAGRATYGKPWIGEVRHDYDRFFMQFMASPENDVVNSLVSQKLYDLDNAKSGLGFLLGVVIMKTNWIFVEDPLSRTCDSNGKNSDPNDDIIDVDMAGVKVVQIANRFEREVRIHRASWNKMSAGHRAALIIHEAIYSLAGEVGENDTCLIPMAKTGQFVTWAFNEDKFRRGLSDDIVEFFQLNKIQPSDAFQSKYKGEFYTRFGLIAWDYDKNRKDFRADANGVDMGEVNLKEPIAELCSKLISSKLDVFKVSAVVIQPPFRVTPTIKGYKFESRPNVIIQPAFNNDDGDDISYQSGCESYMKAKFAEILKK